MRAALKLAAVDANSHIESASVSFRHLALLAQIKADDASVWESLATSHGIAEPTPPLVDRLRRMRTWIGSEHFPSEMRVHIRSSPDDGALTQLTDEQCSVVHQLPAALAAAEWNPEGIGAAFKAISEAHDLSMRDVFRACYAVFMGSERGPRLAPILATCSKEELIALADACSVLC